MGVNPFIRSEGSDTHTLVKRKLSFQLIRVWANKRPPDETEITS